VLPSLGLAHEPEDKLPFCSPAFQVPPAQPCGPRRDHGSGKVCIDLSQDADGDGLPDELVDAIDQILHSAPSEQTAAIFEMVRRLPYSQRTLDLQAKVAVASLQLDVCTLTDAERDKLAMKVQDFLDAMMTDPGYARAQEAIQAILTKDFEVQFPVPPLAAVPACELTGTLTGPLCVGFNLTENQSCVLRQVTTGDIVCLLIETSPIPIELPPGPELNWDRLSMGDLVLRRAIDRTWQTLIYAIFYTHSATWNGDRQLYEAIRQGVVLTRLDDWITGADDVAIGFNNVTGEFQAEGLSWAKERYGTDGRTRFDFLRHFNKEKDSQGLYCSQLNWLIHRHIAVDIDSQDSRVAIGMVAKWGVLGAAAGARIGGFAGPVGAAIGLVAGFVTGGSAGFYVSRIAVLPDEIFWSPHVDWYYIGKMPHAPGG